jgi:DNA helicase HerA-like ATPase
MGTAAVSSLQLGWRVNRGLDPEYWLKPPAKTGKHDPEDLVSVSASQVAGHTVVVAQSGSGKSFFLGRLVEELALRTKARCVVLDPNGDFLQVDTTADEKLWKGAGYRPGSRDGFLPTESHQAFKTQWDKLPFLVRSVRDGLGLAWKDIPPEFINADLDPVLAGEVYQCHRLVQQLALILPGRAGGQREEADLLAEAEYVLGQSRLEGSQQAGIRRELERRYRINDLLESGLKRLEEESRQRFREAFPSRPESDLDVAFLRTIHRPLLERSVGRALEACLALPRYITPQASTVYFGRARRFESVFSFDGSQAAPDAQGVLELPRVEVMDLTSIAEPETRRLAVSSFINTEFERLRRAWETLALGEPDSRVPTFLVVDEAHNLIPGGEVGRSKSLLREQFRTIAAEGRKFGFFLVLATQRPDKIDSQVVSECENRVVMKLGSQAVLKITCDLLGLEDVPQKQLEKTLEFDTGRGLLYGRWTNGSTTLFYGAARRTKEGGRNLRPDYWARP